jgi:hypothetical protein
MARATPDKWPDYVRSYAATEGISVRAARNDLGLQERWINRGRSKENMAELLAYTLGIAYDEALEWLTYEETT